MTSPFIPGPGTALAAALLLQPEPPPQLHIESILIQGKGCPQPGSVTAELSADKQSLVLVYDEMRLENPPGPPLKSLNCQTAVKLQVPAGWQITPATIGWRGSAALADKITARLNSGYFHAGVPLGSHAHALTGPHDDVFEFLDPFTPRPPVWSPCGTSTSLGINTTLKLDARANPTGEAALNTLAPDPGLRMHVQWHFQKC